MMALAVPFGQYVPGTSAVHRLDARFKLLIVTSFVFALFMVDGWTGLLLCAVLLLGAYLLARIPLKLALRGFKPILVILIFTFLANTLTLSAGGDAGALTSDLAATGLVAPNLGALPDSIALIGSFGIKPLGALRGLYFVLRILLLISITSLLTFTSSVVALSDALTALMRPLAVLRVPTEDIATMFSIALRFIPLTAEEAEKIMVAQSARAAVFDKGGLIKRARAWVPVMIPLFVNLFRRADELAAAMETRCYTGRGRTHLKVYVLKVSDLVIGCCGALFFVAAGIFL